MSFQITQQQYGKSRVRLTKLKRDQPQHQLIEYTVEILLDGDFNTAYTNGDNSQVIPTDTVKNTVFALGRKWDGDSAESFAIYLANHFIQQFGHVSSVEITIKQPSWIRVETPDGPHPFAFVKGGSEVRTVELFATRETIDSPQITSGLSGLEVLKTTESGFVDYLIDSFTTLQPTEDRIFATTVQAGWQYVAGTDLGAIDFNGLYESVRAILIREFAARYSPSVQTTLYEMATAVLEAQPIVSEVQLKMPNQHRLLVDLKPFGMDNPNTIFIATDEPHGTISATIARG